MSCFRKETDIAYLKKYGKSTIGHGAYGNVSIIQHSLSKEGPFALKKMPLIDHKETRYIKREIELHRALDHPFIIKMKDHFYENETAFVILEYASGGNLYHYIHKSLFIPKQDLLGMFTQIVLAVEYLHKQNVLHRDIKPENILLDEKRNAKLCDFGWSTECTTYQIRNTFCGTPEYMSPEIIYGRGQTHKSDIYSLGRAYRALVMLVWSFEGNKRRVAV